MASSTWNGNGRKSWSEIFQQLLSEFGPDIFETILPAILDEDDLDFLAPDKLELFAYFRDDLMLWWEIVRTAKARKVPIDLLKQGIAAWRWKHAQRFDPYLVNTAPPLELVAGDVLMQRAFPEPNYLLPGLIHTGLSLIAGRPKKGKSWFALALAIAAATGGQFLNQEVAQGNVLYLDLESPDVNLHRRLHTLIPEGTALPQRLQIGFNAQRISTGLLPQLAGWVAKAQAPRLIVIDTLAHVRPESQSRRDPYQVDYETIAPLQRFAHDKGVSILLVHHTRKAPAEAFDMIAGTTGISGAADTLLVLERKNRQAETTLHVTGRDVEEQELALHFDSGLWTLLGDAETHQSCKTCRDILQALHEIGRPAKPQEVCNWLGDYKPNTIRRTMRRMAQNGKLDTSGDGLYTPHVPPPPGNDPGKPPVPRVPPAPPSDLTHSRNGAYGHTPGGTSEGHAAPSSPTVPGVPLDASLAPGSLGTTMDTEMPETAAPAMAPETFEGLAPMPHPPQDAVSPEAFVAADETAPVQHAPHPAQDTGTQEAGLYHGGTSPTPPVPQPDAAGQSPERVQFHEDTPPIGGPTALPRDRGTQGTPLTPNDLADPVQPVNGELEATAAGFAAHRRSPTDAPDVTEAHGGSTFQCPACHSDTVVTEPQERRQVCFPVRLALQNASSRHYVELSLSREIE